MNEKKPLRFPLWVDGLLVAGLLVMSWVEASHGQMGWAVVFGVGGVLFGGGVLARFLKRGSRDES